MTVRDDSAIPNTTVENLRRARGLIDKPSYWCQGEYRIGHRCCAQEAIITAARSTREAMPAILALERIVGCVVQWNDAAELHAEIMAGFDAAIAEECARAGR